MADWTINTKLADRLRTMLPLSGYMFFRNIAAALLTPVLFSKRTGHFRSSLKARSVDRDGKPIPWYTYPAVDFLAGKDYSGKRVLEFGAGHSTLWWMERAAEVVGIEGSEQWLRHLQSLVSKNVILHLMRSPKEDLAPLLKGRQFDIIVIDGVDGTGCDRGQAARIIIDMNLLAPGGAIVFDDSEGSFEVPGNEWQKSAQNVNYFREHGFSRVDFFGYAPGQLQWRCTSIFFKHPCFLFDGKEVPRKSDA
jgi:methyltransferase family protein